MFFEVTMWESIMRHKITYLQPYPSNYLPFYKNIIENFRSTFFHKGELREWELPDPTLIPENKGFNFFNNKYYSCC